MGDGMLSLAWNNHSSTFCHMLSVLRGMERYTDATVACEGKFYSVHKLVLASCSEYFFEMFEKTPCKHPVVVLKDIHGKEMEALLSYMYDGVVSVAQSDLAKLITAAEVLQIKGLAVPDEPPSSTRKAPHTRCSSDDRSSPQHKRSKREDTTSVNRQQKNHDSSLSESPNIRNNSDKSTPRPRYDSQNESNLFRNQKETDFRENTDNVKRDSQNVEEGRTSSPEIETIEDDTIVKEEAHEDNDFDYANIAQGLDTESGDGMKSTEGLGIPSVNFNSPTADQSYDSQAGPSGLQLWPSMEGEMSNQGYPSDSNSSTAGSSQQPHHTVMETRNCHFSANLIPGDLFPHELSHVGNVTPLASCGQESSINFNAAKFHHCPSCSFSTPDEAELSSHICTDKPRKSFSCPYCPYSTDVKANVTRHKRSHTGEKPYACPFCPHRCALSSNLRIHIRSHTGERPYKCSQCPASFVHSTHLKNHTLSIHEKS